jgi:hypothetical protein
MNSTETTFTFANNQYESFTQICAEIREKIDVLDDHNFEDFEQDMYNLSIVFYNMWSPYINFEENRMSVTIDKTRFVNEIRLLYNTFYLLYGNKKLMDEIEQMLQEDPDSINDVNEYLEFVELLRAFENYSENDIDNPESIYTEKIKKVQEYIKKKNREMKELNDTMNSFADKLEQLSQTIGNIVNK